jgi:hypothetical protein
VVDVVLGHTVRYVSIETEGTDYRDECVTAINHVEYPYMGLIPVPSEASDHAIATIVGNMAMCREAGKPNPWDSWQELISDCEYIEYIGDPDEMNSDTMMVRKYCELAALEGHLARVPASDELSEGAPPLPQIPSTGEEAFEIVLREAKSLVGSYWRTITAVAESLMEVGFLSGEEVREIVFGSDPSEDGPHRAV